MAMTDSGQLQPEDTLDDRGVDDVLDEGISPPERLRGSTAKSVTARGQRERELIADRVAQEDPEAEDIAEAGVESEERAGRLVAPDEGAREDTEKDAVAEDVGIDGAGASAEEAAVHIKPE